MGITIERDDERKRFTAVATDALTLAEILRFMSTHRVGAYRAYALLFDVRDRLRLTRADVRTMGDHVGSLTRREGARGLTAIVAAGESYELAQLYAAAAKRAGVQIGVFASVDDAGRWLDAGADVRP